MKKILFIRSMLLLLLLLGCSCTTNRKSEEFAAKADGRILFALIWDFRVKSGGKLPVGLIQLDYSSLNANLAKDGSPLTVGWIYSFCESAQLELNPIILEKRLSDGSSVIVRANGTVTAEK